MKNMNIKNIVIAILIILFGWSAKGQGSLPNPAAGNEISVRFVPLAAGGPKQLKAKTVDGDVVKIGDQKMYVDKILLTQLNKRRSVNYWYSIRQEGPDSSYVMTAMTKKNAIGLSGSHLFPGDITNWKQWLPENLEHDFKTASYKLYDFCFGLNINNQLWAKNRHSISLDFDLHYRQMHHEFNVPDYGISFPSVDPDGYDYERLVSVTDYNETYTTHAAALSLAFRYDFYFLKYISLFMSAGAENVFTMLGHSVTNFDACYAGQYGPELFNVVIDENGFYDFGTYNNNYINSRDQTQFRYTLFGAANVGLQFYLGRTVSLEVAGVYQRLFYNFPIEKKVDNFRLSEEPGQYQSMMSALSPLAKNRLGVNVKFKINF